MSKKSQQNPPSEQVPSLGQPFAELDLNQVRYEDDEDDGDPTLEELFELTIDAVERAVDSLIHWPDEDAAEDVVCDLRDEIIDLAGDWEASGPKSVFGILASCLNVPRRAGLPIGSSVGWVSERLGAQAGDDALLLGSVLGYAPATALTYIEVQDKLSNDVVTVMLWMVAGLAATTGRGRAAWIRQFIPYPEF